ncbi:MAG: hypothetical protein LBD25_01760 [Coriobacteriales bacterium]|jgi:hypothetical protein|nr:hypothetical protein [Coriobacteriales bacterium]
MQTLENENIANVIIAVIPALICSIVQTAMIGLLIFLFIRRFTNVAKVQNNKLTDRQRYEALDKITGEKKITKLAMTSDHLLLHDTVTAKVNDPILLEKLARGASRPIVRVAAFEKAFSQLADDKALCQQIVEIMDIRPGVALGNYSSYKPELLLLIAARHPDIIRRFWTRIERAHHIDIPRAAHDDKPGWSSDCGRDHTDRILHKDLSAPEALERFPPAVKGSAALGDAGRLK